jgi:hypothetical protein
LYSKAASTGIVYASAELHDADFLTLDAHFKDLERTAYFEKT